MTKQPQPAPSLGNCPDCHVRLLEASRCDCGWRRPTSPPPPRAAADLSRGDLAFYDAAGLIDPLEEARQAVRDLPTPTVEDLCAARGRAPETVFRTEDPPAMNSTRSTVKTTLIVCVTLAALLVAGLAGWYALRLAWPSARAEFDDQRLQNLEAD